MYIMGDLNGNLLSTECGESKSLTSFNKSFNLLQLIAAPTRVTKTRRYLLDVTLALQTKQVVKAGVMDSSISDHDMVFSILHLKVSQPKTTHITTRSLKNYNPDTFQFDMSGAPWSVVKVFDDVDDKLHAFDLLFNEILDHHAPIRSIKVRGKPNPCITEEIRELMKSRNVWRKTARRTNDPHAWSTYKNLKHQVRKCVKHCLDRTSLLTVRNALVFSKLYLCSNVWANTTQKNIRKLQVVQNFACQIVRTKKVCLGYPLRTNYTTAKLSWLLNAFLDMPPNI